MSNKLRHSRSNKVHPERVVRPRSSTSSWSGGLDWAITKAPTTGIEGHAPLCDASRTEKNQFLAMLSHELRTPLTPALLAVSSLIDDPATPDLLRPALAIALEGISREAQLIEQLLDASQISRGRLRLQFTTVDLTVSINDAISTCQRDLNPSGPRLVFENSAQSYHCQADPARIHQILCHLIRNAVKWSNPGAGRIHVMMTNPSPGWVEVAVADMGIGIETDALDRIFEMFEQGGSAPRERVEGLGLGLAISRGLAIAHGGKLVAESGGHGTGATFRFSLPGLDSRTEGPKRENSPGVSPSKPASLRILLVEDNGVTLRFLGELLRLRGHGVLLASNLSIARELAASHEFDLLISDIELPDGTGLELMRELAPLGIPAIALSGFGSEEDVRMSFEAGFLEHLTKPVEIAQLERALDQIMM